MDFFDQGNGSYGLLNGQLHDIRINGLEDKIKGPPFHGLDHHGNIFKGSDHDHRDIGMICFKDRQSINPVHHGQADIHEHKVRRPLVQ